ncbi:MAG: hypothetical protein AAGE05_04335 [Pseudomonadota bacterium]
MADATNDAVKLGNGAIVTTVDELCEEIIAYGGEHGPALVKQIRKLEGVGESLGDIFDRLRRAAKNAEAA